MDRSLISISNEEAKRIKEVAAEEFRKLRKSLSPSEIKIDNSNLSRNSYTKSHIIQAEKIREVTTEVFTKLSEPSEHLGTKSGHSNVADGTKKVEEVNLVRRPSVYKYLSSTEKRNGEEKRSPKLKNSYRSRYRIVRPPSSSTKISTSNAEVIDSPVNNLICRKPNHYTDSVRRSSPLSIRNVLNRPEGDFSPIIVDCTNPSSRFGVDISTPNFSGNNQKSPSNVIETLNRSNSIEVLSEKEITVVSGGLSGNRLKELCASHSIETNSWENFVAHLIAIQRNDNFRDLFIHDDIAIFNEFTGLCMAAQTIFINLLNSEYTWYRALPGAFKNTEISQELEPFIDTLIKKQFLIADTSIEEIGLLVELLSIQELRGLCKVFGLRCDGSKGILSDSLIKFSKNLIDANEGKCQDDKNFIKEEILKILGRVVKLNHTHRELFLRTQLLYALPLASTMEADGRIQLITIMNDVSGGKVTYPHYVWEPLQKLFSSRDSLVRFQHALLLEANITWKMKSKDFDEVVNLHESASILFQEELRDDNAREWSAHLPNYLRTFTRGTVLARAIHHSIECLRVKKMYTKMISVYETLLSQDLYLNCYKGIWYDQLAHIYQHIMRDISKTVIFLTEALVDPSLNFMDRILLSKRAYPIVKFKRKRKAEAQMYEELKSTLCILKGVQEIPVNAGCFDGKTGKDEKFSYVYETEEGVGQILSTPEEVIMLHFKQCGYGHGIHSSWGIGSSLFGILFWDIIYNLEVPNVFLCPFQSLPLDLTTGEFYTNREKQINTRLVQIRELWDDPEMDDHIFKTWTIEEGKKSVVFWKIFEDLKQFQVIVKCIGRKLLAKICEKMAKNFHLLQKGFPSMILWNQTTKACKFIQVKEPNSHLTPSQTSWLLHLSTAGGDAFACFVNSVGSKAQKRKLNAADNLEDSMELDIF